ncbi:MAG: 50S ribosomal protein L4 [Candidatus Brocadiales bacterium]|nr:50S ribosomal protein L4 [Candidatus Bathyanammoxibius amoris]
MIELAVYDTRGKEVEKLELEEARFGGEVRKVLLKDAVIMYEANRRVGTACTKTRAEVKGTGKKPWAQKHTGRARAGSLRSPLFRGGGVVFGPKPRDYSYHMPKKARRQALRSAMLGKLLDAEVKVIDKLEFSKPSTKKMVSLLKALGIEGSCLVVAEDNDHTIWKSARNVPGLKVMKATQLNAYEIIKHGRLLITRSELGNIG